MNGTSQEKEEERMCKHKHVQKKMSARREWVIDGGGGEKKKGAAVRRRSKQQFLRHAKFFPAPRWDGRGAVEVRRGAGSLFSPPPVAGRTYVRLYHRTVPHKNKNRPTTNNTEYTVIQRTFRRFHGRRCGRVHHCRVVLGVTRSHTTFLWAAGAVLLRLLERVRVCRLFVLLRAALVGLARGAPAGCSCNSSWRSSSSRCIQSSRSMQSGGLSLHQPRHGGEGGATRLSR